MYAAINKGRWRKENRAVIVVKNKFYWKRRNTGSHCSGRDKSIKEGGDIITRIYGKGFLFRGFAGGTQVPV